MKLISALFFLFALGGKPAFADEPEAVEEYRSKLVPKCTLYRTSDGKEVCGYTLEEWKEVLVVDRTAVHTQFRLKQEEERTEALSLEVLALREQVEAYAVNQETLKGQNARLTKQLIDLDKKYQDERVKPRLGSTLPWAVAAVSTALLVGVLVESSLD